MVISGGEDLLADRAVRRIGTQLRQADPGVTVTTVAAAGYEPGQLSTLTSPSLFGEPRMVVITGLAEGNDAALADVDAYLKNNDPDPDVTVVLVHSGGAKGKKVIQRAVDAGAPSVHVPVIKRDTDRLALVAEEFTDAGRRISTRAAQSLVDAFGSDLRELAASCAQLIADVDGDVDEDDVRRYYGGRAEATGFEVADAVATRDRARAMLALRRALDTGVDPIPLVAAIASRLRLLAKVSAVSGSGAQVAAEIGAAPWMVDKARRELRAWTPAELGEAIIVLAEVDVALKGGVEVAGVVRGASADHTFTLERMVRATTAPRRSAG
ncbi:MAG: DNA polymerase III subunit delta [Micrococcales bacterium]|nr:MAG: DNA polymerase III subunit delta [Micrococcales bacterium]